MSKQSKADAADPKSVKDAGYRFAMQGETTRAIAQYILEQCPGFLTEIPKETRADLFAGFQLRKHELTGDKYYKLGEGGTYIPLQGKPDASITGIVCMNINVAMSYSPQEFGKLRETDPAKHSIIQPMRDAFSTYASNKIAELKRVINSIENEGKPRARAANKTFREAMNAVFDSYEKRVKTAAERSDVDAKPEQYRIAKAAFWKAYDA